MIYNIQALRGLAALLVVLIHLKMVLQPAGVPGEWLTFGGSGVDLFFVISGFVMVHTTARKPQRAGYFLINRIIRVVPLYWLFTLALASAGLALPAIFLSFHVAVPDLIRSLLFIPYRQPEGTVFPVLFVGWTLNYEMFLYALFALTMPLAASPERGVALRSALLVAIVTCGALLEPKAAAPSFYTDSIILEFAMGMLVATSSLRGVRLPRLASMALLPIALAVLIGQGFVPSGLPRALVAGIPAMAIVAAAVSLETRGAAMRNAGVQLLGAASYALYLIHPFLAWPFSKVSLHFASPALSWLFALLMIGTAIAVAILVHLLIERPINVVLRRLASHPRMLTEKAEPSLVSINPGEPGVGNRANDHVTSAPGPAKGPASQSPARQKRKRVHHETERSSR